MHTHTTRSRALVINEDHLHNHENPSYNVHDTHTHVGARTHTHIHICKHIYIMHNAITHSKKVKQTLPTFQGYGPVRYRKCKTDIAIPRERNPSKE